MTVCAVWLARDFLRRTGRPIDIPPCTCPTADCPPIEETDMTTTPNIQPTDQIKAFAQAADDFAAAIAELTRATDEIVRAAKAADEAITRTATNVGLVIAGRTQQS